MVGNRNQHTRDGHCKTQRCRPSRAAHGLIEINARRRDKHHINRDCRARRRSRAIMNDYGTSMGFGWIGILLFLIVVGLIIAALIKYLRS